LMRGPGVPWYNASAPREAGEGTASLMETPYQRFKDEELILRDELAVDRTLLANERTLLAYLRAASPCYLPGHVHPVRQDPLVHHAGVFCLPAGCAVILFGAYRFRRMQRTIGSLRENRLPSHRGHQGP